MAVVEECPNEAAMPREQARTASTIRIGKIARGILFIWDTWFLASAVKLLNPWLGCLGRSYVRVRRSEEHTSELQSHSDLVCRLLLEKKKNESDYVPWEHS